MTTQQTMGFKVTCSGQYYAGSGRDKQLKMFKQEVFYIPQTVEIAIGRKFIEKLNKDGKKIKISVPDKKTVSGKAAAQHVIQRRLLGTRLAEKFEDFAGVRTCQILDIRPSAIPAEHIIDITRPVEQMTLNELKTLVALESLDTNPAMFADLEDARMAIAQELREKKGKGRPALAPDPDEAEVPAGVTASSGPVSSDDGVPIDEEDPAAGLM